MAIKAKDPNAEVELLKDQGITGNFEVTVDGELAHSKKTVAGHKFDISQTVLPALE